MDTHMQAAASINPAAQDLHLLPIPAIGSRAFWAVHAINDDTMCRAYSELLPRLFKHADVLQQHSMWAAEGSLRREAHRSFNEAHKDGALLFAWYGSSVAEGGAA